jgi:hypothetical protein
MIVIKTLGEADQISNIAIRELVRQRADDLGGDSFVASVLGYFLVIEPGDTLDAIATQIGFSIIANMHTAIRYDQEGFTPSFEFVEELPTCFDLVFILDDSGYGIEVLVPKLEVGVPPDLLAMCQRFAFTGDADDGP